MRNNFTSVRRCLTSFRKKIVYYVLRYFQNLITQNFFNFRLKLTAVAIATSRSGWSRSTRGRGRWSSESWENPGTARLKLKLSTGFRYVKVLNSRESISLKLVHYSGLLFSSNHICMHNSHCWSLLPPWLTIHQLMAEKPSTNPFALPPVLYLSNIGEAGSRLEVRRRGEYQSFVT